MVRGEIPLHSKRVGRDGLTDFHTVVWVHRLGPNGGAWEVKSFGLNVYSPARRYRVEVYGDKNGISEMASRAPLSSR